MLRAVWGNLNDVARWANTDGTVHETAGRCRPWSTGKLGRPVVGPKLESRQEYS